MPNPKTLNEMYSVVSYTGDGVLKEFSIPFPYLYREDIHVYFINYDEDGNEVRTELKVYPLVQSTLPPSTFDVYFLSEATLKFVVAPAEWQTIEIRRITNRLESEVVFSNSSVLTEEDLNLISTQLLYIVQEAYDNQTLNKLAIEAFNAENLKLILKAKNEAVEYSEHALKARDEIVSIYDSTVDLIENQGDIQVERLEKMSDMAGLANGVACASATWTFEKDTPKGSIIKLPEGMFYIAGRHHLRISYDGVTLSDSWFDEIPIAGDEYNRAESFMTKMDFKAGQELHVWISPLGLADVPDIVRRVGDIEKVLSMTGIESIIARVSALEDGLADLSRRVVYSEPENN